MKIPPYKLRSWNLANQRVILRADLNLPTNNGVVLDTFRLEKTVPTINAILAQGASLTIMTHLGRPAGTDPALSIRILEPCFAKHDIPVSFAATPQEAAANPSRIVLLENLRFFPGETGRDAEFARQLAALGDYYVNDAFGTLHRNDTSITLVPQLFPPDRRSIGLLVQQEMTMLEAILMPPTQPFCVVLGGSKVAEKVPFINYLLENSRTANYLLGNAHTTILVCPAMAMTFAKALGIPVGMSLVDHAGIELCTQILGRAKEIPGVTIMLPTDYQIARGSLDGPLENVDADKIPNDGIAVSLGPATIDRYCQELVKAGTTFLNGTFGFFHRPETLQGMGKICTAMALEHGEESVIAGGDAVAAARMLGCAENILFLSTGGGATLAYVSKKPLPGLEALAN